MCIQSVYDLYMSFCKILELLPVLALVLLRGLILLKRNLHLLRRKNDLFCYRFHICRPIMAPKENLVRMRYKIEISGLYSGNNRAARNFCLDKNNIYEKSVAFAIR